MSPPLPPRKRKRACLQQTKKNANDDGSGSNELTTTTNTNQQQNQQVNNDNQESIANRTRAAARTLLNSQHPAKKRCPPKSTRTSNVEVNCNPAGPDVQIRKSVTVPTTSRKRTKQFEGPLKKPKPQPKPIPGVNSNQQPQPNTSNATVQSPNIAANATKHKANKKDDVKKVLRKRYIGTAKRRRGIKLKRLNGHPGPSPHTGLPNLPDIAVTEILRNLPPSSYQEKTILSCRLVSTNWNHLITHTSQLMNKVIFPVRNPTQFLTLPIVQAGQIKSIQFKDCTLLDLAAESTETGLTFDKFMSTINHTKIEKINISFENGSQIQQAQIFNHLILPNFPNLQELTFNNFDKEYSSIQRNEVFRYVNDTTTTIAWSESMKYISIDVRGFSLLDSLGFSKFLLKLPNLECIKIFGECTNWLYHLMVIRTLCEYLMNYGPCLRLKVSIMFTVVYVNSPVRRPLLREKCPFTF